MSDAVLCGRCQERKPVTAFWRMIGNVKVISWRANRLKADATADELAAVLHYMRGGAK